MGPPTSTQRVQRQFLVVLVHRLRLHTDGSNQLLDQQSTATSILCWEERARPSAPARSWTNDSTTHGGSSWSGTQFASESSSSFAPPDKLRSYESSTARHSTANLRPSEFLLEGVERPLRIFLEENMKALLSAENDRYNSSQQRTNSYLSSGLYADRSAATSARADAGTGRQQQRDDTRQDSHSYNDWQ